MIKNCKYCGNRFSTHRSNAKYCCERCRYEAKKKMDRESYKSPHIQEQPKNKNANLIEINRRAREAGMSYGKYVAQKYMEESK